MLKHKVKTLYKGKVAVPEMYIRRANREGKMKISYNNDIMTVTDLRNYAYKIDQKHKYKEGTYKLYYYTWRPDDDKNREEVRQASVATSQKAGLQERLF